MLNTTYHTKEAIKKAEQIASNKIFDAGTTDQDKEAYMSLLIFCDYDEVKASQFYSKLVKNGWLSLYDVCPWTGTKEIGWVVI